MLGNSRSKITLSGITMLAIGVALLIFTFVSAYGFLTQSLTIIASGDLVQTFGDALSPLITTSIRIMYLGVMGWIASIVTARGVTIVTNVPKMAETTALKPTVSQCGQTPQKPKKGQAIEKEGPPEPEIVAMPPEEIPQSPSDSGKT
ncbi:hypothetical protein MUP01_07300 [Candidatus Bathyarchaeota archaeon]|nr:hypothetical protein [Candidatus Bathyarchaeota archaeon]